MQGRRAVYSVPPGWYNLSGKQIRAESLLIRGGFMRRKIPVVTFIILAMNVAGLIYEYSVGERTATYRFGMYQGALQNGEYLRAFVSAFLHFGIYHFGSNMICLVLYGFSLENRIGPLKYAVVYILSIAGGSLLINFAGGRGLHAGASGAIWGLMTATLVYNLRNKQNPFYALRGIVLNLVYSFQAGVSWQAHIGGGAAGLAAALALFCLPGGTSAGRRNSGGQYPQYPQE